MDLSQLSDEELIKLYQQEQQAQKTPEQMTDEELMAAYNQEQAAIQQQRADEGFLPDDMQLIKSLGAAAEVMGSGVTGALSGVVSYPYGMYETYMAGEDAGDKARQQFREDYTYRPRTEYGQRLEKNIGEFMQPAVEYMTEKTQALGEATTEATGSPTAGYAVEHLPMFLLDALGSYGITKALQAGTTRQVPLKNPDGSPTTLLRKALDKRGISYENLPVEQQAAIPAVVDKNMVTRRTGAGKVAQQALESEVQAGTATTGAATLRPGEKGGVQKDPYGKEAVRQGWEEGFVSMAKQANEATKDAMIQMLQLRRNIFADETVLKPKIDPLTGKQSTVPRRPTDIPGDAFLEKARFVEGQATKAAQRLNEIVKTRLPDVKINTMPLEDVMLKGLTDMDIKIVDQQPSGRPILDFRGSNVSKNPAAKGTINDVLDLFEEMGTGQMSAAQFHKMKLRLDDLIDYRKSGTNEGSLTTQAKNYVKMIRRNLNDEIRKVDPEYAQINDQLTRTFEAFDTVRDGLGKNLDMTSTAVGTNLRRLFNNTNARSKVENAVLDVDMLAQELGGNFPVSIWELSNLAAKMDNMMKPVPETGLGATVRGSLAEKATTGKSSAQTVLDIGKAIYDKGRGINANNQLNALEELLRRSRQQTGRQEPTIGNLPAVRNNTDLMP
jgi:hypothetical protein